MAPAVHLEYTKVKELKKRKSSSDLSFTMIGNPQGSSTFPPDYRHAETMAESEGFGSSCRVDSEDSAAPKRKCLRLNTNNCGDFNVPLQVISLSKMSRSERKELAMKLRAELKQTQNLQKTISMRAVPCISGAAVSSSSNGHRMKPDTIGQNATQLLKRGITGRFESSKRAQPRPSISSSVAMLMKPCAQLLNQLMTHKYSWVFNKPVDIVKLNIPDYFSVIKHPMDLGTIKDRINSGFYSSPHPFAADVRLTFTNALTYNPPKNDVHIMADTLSKLFEQRWKDIEMKLAAAGSHVRRDSEPTKVEPQSKQRKVPPVSHNMLMTERVKPKMTMEEKENLNRRLESIIMDPPAHIIEFLRRHSGNANQASEEDEMEMEIDIGCLSDDVLFELGKLLDAHLREKQTIKQEKAEPCEMEILNESGLSNSSMHPSKGNEPVDEDVDIGGNDPPVSSYPPVEIEKDTAPRSSKCSTSSSSSSDSGSSSSDSDSGSSSGSESNERVGSPPKMSKDNAGRDAAVDQEKSDLMNPLDISRSAGNELDREVEHKKAVSIETDSCLIEGENAPSERHVSPDKLYRAAILRSRFADTILKAREKTLDQDDKGDPDKMRRDREELERQKREEKARLQAEAKAAEEARRRAEIEAAAEAKRKRELEREAARQALLKMERTVEINENSLNPKDWEMLGTAPMDHLPSSAEEASPDVDSLGGFNLGGSSNPLEQLGLYMKADDEEDEEGEPPVLLPASNDVEEGEID